MQSPGWWTFLLLAVVLVLVPGPDFVVVVRNTLAGGRTRGLWSAVGVASAASPARAGKPDRMAGGEARPAPAAERGQPQGAWATGGGPGPPTPNRGTPAPTAATVPASS